MKSRRYEIEIKLRISNPRRLKKRLREMGYRPATPRTLERNILFDFPGSTLAQSCQALRLRSVAGEHLLTFKGPPRPSRKYKIRPETETRIENPAALGTILDGLRLRRVFEYQKYRTPYARASGSDRHESGALFYDETLAGNFVELEGSPDWIDRVAREMGYGPDAYITASYVELYRQELRRRIAAKCPTQVKVQLPRRKYTPGCDRKPDPKSS